MKDTITFSQINKIKNPHQKCYHRDKNILTEIQKCKALTTDQIEILFFNNLKSGNQIARRRLAALRKNKHNTLDSNRISFDQPQYHFVDKKYKNYTQIKHLILTNWMYIYLKKKKLTQSEPIIYFDHEIVYKTLRTDGFVCVDNLFEKERQFYFIETDISHNVFDKIKKYNKFLSEEIQPVYQKYYEAKEKQEETNNTGQKIQQTQDMQYPFLKNLNIEYEQQQSEFKLEDRYWWVKETDIFPTVLIITNRVNHVKTKIAIENENGISFQVYDVDEVKGYFKKNRN